MSAQIKCEYCGETLNDIEVYVSKTYRYDPKTQTYKLLFQSADDEKCPSCGNQIETPWNRSE